MTIDTDKIEKMVEKAQKDYDIENFAQSVLDAVETLKKFWKIFVEEEE